MITVLYSKIKTKKKQETSQIFFTEMDGICGTPLGENKWEF